MIQKKPFDLHMPKNILIDLNIILDVLLQRNGFEASRETLRLGETGDSKLHISAHSVTTLAYLLERAKVPRSEISRHIDWTLHAFQVVPVNANLLQKALNSRIVDYEDAVIEKAALACDATHVITRNIKDFRLSGVEALTSERYLNSRAKE
jgi:predicted nucleic-acid-binding protein